MVLAITACGDDSPIVPESTGGGDESSGTTTGVVTDDSATSGQSGSSSGGDSGPGSTGGESGEESTTGPVIECGNDVIEGEEVCDGADLGAATCETEGYDGGELGCNANCGGMDVTGCYSFQCGDGMAQGMEECDGGDMMGATCLTQGFDSGNLGCRPNCSFNTTGCGTCGNVILDGDEVCDSLALLGQTCLTQGFDSGQLGCAPDCYSYDTTPCGTCGNAIIDGTEQCDTAQLGGADCFSAGFDSGSLGCNQATCTYDTASCGMCGNGVVDGDEECDDANTGTQCLAGCVFCPGGGVIFEETFANNAAGWTLGMEWGIGPAVSSPSPGSCGNGDPGTDHTPTADNGIGGAVIGGNVSTAVHDFYYLTSPVIDTSGYTYLELDFWRWLNSDYTRFMDNRVEIWDGAAWQLIWNSGPPPNVEDATWTNVSYDIAAYANPAMQVRIGYNVGSAGVYTCSGWNIDDLQIIGVNCPPP